MLPLTGVKVVEFANNIAGPYAGYILAMLGADVLKIERPEGGDDARAWGPPFRTPRRRSSASTSTRRASRSTSRRPRTSPG